MYHFIQSVCSFIIYTPTAHPMMNLFTPNGVHYPLKAVTLKYFYLLHNVVWLYKTWIPLVRMADKTIHELCYFECLNDVLDHGHVDMVTLSVLMMTLSTDMLTGLL